MTFEILNVEHGFCAYVVGSDGGVLLFDCGHSEMNRPSVYLPARGIMSIRRFFRHELRRGPHQRPDCSSPEALHRNAIKEL